MNYAKCWSPSGNGRGRLGRAKLSEQTRVIFSRKFLTEAVALSIAGGCVGIVLGIAASPSSRPWRI